MNVALARPPVWVESEVADTIDSYGVPLAESLRLTILQFAKGLPADAGREELVPRALSGGFLF